MPGGDRTGPLGQGPGTGRASGLCYGFDTPGYMNRPGKGMGRRFRFGRGFGRTGFFGRSRGFSQDFQGYKSGS